MVTPEQVLTYWVDEVGPKGWYSGGDALDAEVRAQFEEAWHEARAGACGLWMTTPVGVLGYIILTDQMPRNMFRGHARAFFTDSSARAAAKMAIERDWDQRIPAPERQFFYMPLMHSENLIDQDRGVRLFASRMPGSDGGNLRHARAHRDIIRRFGRFPYRNAALERKTTAAEQAWMDAGGYAASLRHVDSLDSAATQSG